MSVSRFDPNEVIRDFAERVERLGISYMLTGSMAMMKYAMPRSTMDIDIVIELNYAQTADFIQVLEPDYYVPHEAVSRAVSGKKMFNVIHQATAFKVDCVLPKDTKFHKQAFNNRQRLEYKGFDVWIITKDDLIISKLWWAKDSHSEQQLRDVKNLMSEGYNHEYVEFWTRELNVTDLFAECQKEIE